MPVELITNIDNQDVTAINHLIPQLSRTTGPLSAGQVEELISQPGVFVFGFRSVANGPIFGMLTLATFKIPTGLRAWIEDVVVDETVRGQGAGRQLVDAAIAKAAQIGARTIDLTSRPTREAANRLYQNTGFELRETNVYRYASK